jgi:phosphatidylglycerol:prolipoprotein diacylglycerol transferase
MKPPFDPVLIHFTPDFGLHWYGILIVVGIVLGTLYATRRAKQDGEDPGHVWNALTLAIVLGIVGARLYHVFSSPAGNGVAGWAYYRQHPIEALYIWKGGLGIYGAAAGGALGIVIYAWRNKLIPWQWLDYAAPGLILAQAIGRWGNFINQELYGPPTNSSWWGLIIDPQHRIAPYDDLAAYPPDTLFHPTFLYESLWNLLVFGALALIAYKWRGRLIKGDITLGYLIGYPLGRFFVEYLRPDAWVLGPMPAAQVFAILCVVGSVTLLIVRHIRARNRATTAETAALEPAMEG